MKLLGLGVVAVALLLGVEGMTIRKDLVSERQAIDADWTDVEAALDHRASLGPELGNLVQAEAPAEAPAIRAVNDARNALSVAEGLRAKVQANARLNEALARLMLLVENYPKLENSKDYAGILAALQGADNKVDVARRRYNEAVEHYNAHLELFPGNLVASVARLGKVDAYFQTPAF
jgi:LemA protein